MASRRLVVLLVAVVVVPLLSGVAAAQGGARAALGRLVNLPRTDILDNLNSGMMLFTQQPASKTEPDSRGGSTTQFFSSSEAFRQQLSLDAGLDASVASVSLSLRTSFQSISGHETEVSVAKAYAQALVSVTYAPDDSLASLTIRDDFLRSFRSLPVIVSNEWQSSSWIQFAEFIEIWGTHVIVAAHTGATFEAYSSSRSSLRYSQQEMSARACLEAEGMGRAIQGCAGFSDEQKRNAVSMEANTRRLAKGGTAATRNRLLTQTVTADNVEAFLNTANADEQPVRYRFRPLWSLLRARFPARSDDWRRATNLGAYYDGMLGFGCRYRTLTSNGYVQPAQWFVFNSTGYDYARCVRRCLGCHSYYLDCFSWAGQCVCAGPSCLVPDDSTPGYHVRVESDRTEGWGGMGCTFEGRNCVCGNQNYEAGCDLLLDSDPSSFRMRYRVIWDQTPQFRSAEESSFLALTPANDSLIGEAPLDPLLESHG